MDRNIFWLWLTLKSSLTPIMTDKLLEYYKTPEAIYKEKDYNKCGFLSPKAKEELSDKSFDAANDVIKRTNDIGGYILTFDDEEYPPLLKKIYSPPYVLYLKGEHLNWDELLTITIVGTRIYSDYGKYATETITKQLVNYGVTIVSGMAKGIDAIAGTTAIKSGGKTIAVLGSGIDVIYPYENRKLCEQIMKNGVVMSEYPPGTRPYKYNFPRRNRIMAGLSYGVVVAQAPEKSGSLITASHAIENNRELFAIPGIFDDINQEGCHNLIRTGAKLVLNARDILEEFPYLEIKQISDNEDANGNTDILKNTEKEEKLKKLENLSGIELDIAKLLFEGEKYLDQIIEKLQNNSFEIIPALTMLEIMGIIKKNENNKYELI